MEKNKTDIKFVFELLGKEQSECMAAPDYPALNELIKNWDDLSRFNLSAMDMRAVAAVRAATFAMASQRLSFRIMGQFAKECREMIEEERQFFIKRSA